MDVKYINGDLKFKFRVSGIIINNNKLLVNQYGKDSYCLPGGYVELGENSEKAILREMKEETNLEYQIIRFYGIAENFFTNLKHQKTHEIDFYYQLNLKKNYSFKELNMNNIEKGIYADVNHHFKWIDIEKIDEYNLFPKEVKEYITKETINFHLIIDN